MQGAGFRLQGAGCRVQGAWFRVQGTGCRVHAWKWGARPSVRQSTAPPARTTSPSASQIAARSSSSRPPLVWPASGSPMAPITEEGLLLSGKEGRVIGQQLMPREKNVFVKHLARRGGGRYCEVSGLLPNHKGSWCRMCPVWLLHARPFEPQSKVDSGTF